MSPGLRARRAQETRSRIAGAAVNLFAAQGFDRVSVVEVARAAGVTEKTVFNHFATKAELVYGADDWFERSMLVAVSQRPPASSVLAAAADFLLERYIAMLTDTERQERQLVLARLVADSETLRVLEQRILARYADALADTIAEEMHADQDDLRPQVTADAVLAVHRATIGAFRRAARTGRPPAEYGPRVIESARGAFTLLADGMDGFAPR